jgi:hypothetical protein
MTCGSGRLVVEYYLSRYGLPSPFKWAIAGRSVEKLEAVKALLAREYPSVKVNPQTILSDTTILATCFFCGGVWGGVYGVSSFLLSCQGEGDGEVQFCCGRVFSSYL